MSQIQTFLFDTTADAYDDSQCHEAIQNGDVLLIPSERVVGLANTWPVAITVESGELHSLSQPEDWASVVKDSRWSVEQIRAAVALAEKHHFPVADWARMAATSAGTD